jgi:hypothetical protein
MSRKRPIGHEPEPEPERVHGKALFNEMDLHGKIILYNLFNNSEEPVISESGNYQNDPARYSQHTCVGRISLSEEGKLLVSDFADINAGIREISINLATQGAHLFQRTCISPRIGSIMGIEHGPAKYYLYKVLSYDSGKLKCQFIGGKNTDNKKIISIDNNEHNLNMGYLINFTCMGANEIARWNAITSRGGSGTIEQSIDVIGKTYTPDLFRTYYSFMSRR